MALLVGEGRLSARPRSFDVAALLALWFDTLAASLASAWRASIELGDPSGCAAWRVSRRTPQGPALLTVPLPWLGGGLGVKRRRNTPALRRARRRR